MKRIVFISFIGILTSLKINAQTYSFIPDSLKLVPLNELFSKAPPSNVEHVYFEDGTKSSFNEVKSLIDRHELVPRMFANKNGRYVALVVEKLSIKYNGIPDSLAKVGYSIGNPNSKKVIIFAQGGPKFHLDIKGFENVFREVGNVDLQNHFIICVHQAQTISSDKFEKHEISFEQAKSYAEETTRMLSDVVNYFQKQNKEVYLVGKSLGSQITQKFLSTYGNIAKRNLIIVGRLDIRDDIWQSYSKGYGYKWNKDGTGIIVSQERPKDILEINRMKIAAGFGYNRFTELLKETDLSNLIYQYGKSDRKGGILTEKELDFLQSKEVTIISFEGGHFDWSINFNEALSKLLKE